MFLVKSVYKKTDTNSHHKTKKEWTKKFNVANIEKLEWLMFLVKSVYKKTDTNSHHKTKKEWTKKFNVANIVKLEWLILGNTIGFM